MEKILAFAVTLALLLNTVGADFFEDLRASECTNCDEIAEKVGYTDPAVNAFDLPTGTLDGYDSAFKTQVSCTVHVDQKRTADEGVLVYSLKERGTPGDSAGEGKYETHTEACGVCSDLKSLASYLQFPTLEQEVTTCGIQSTFAILGANGISFDPSDLNQVIGALFTLRQKAVINDPNDPVIIPPPVVDLLKACIFDGVQLEGLCLAAWTWSVINVGIYCGAPCAVAALAVPPAPLNSPVVFPPLANPLFAEYCDENVCPNTINGDPACYPEASDPNAFDDSGPLRINRCLQCEECYLNPRFSKVAGRLRRNSGLESGINRPDYLVPDNIEHDYGLL